MKLCLMVTCLADSLRPGAARSTVGLLRRLGHEIEFREAQTCCGQPLMNSGFFDAARQQAQYTIGVFEGSETVVTPSGSCAAMVKHEYPRLFEDDASWRRRAEELAARTFELSELLVHRLKVLDVGARYAGRVTYHYACHLRGLHLTDEVEQLLAHVADAVYVPLPRQDQCCGFGGSFSVRYPQISEAMVNDKCRAVAQTTADCLVSTDTGCLMNIEGRLRRLGQRVDVLHLAELLERR